MTERVAVALSGGVDSAVAAYLLLSRGYEVKGFFLKLFPDSDPKSAIAVAEHLGIELEVIDLADEFDRLVVDPFVQSYLAGRTPNPCALCNPRIKFGTLMDIAGSQGFTKLSTGHYARLVCDASHKPHLYRADHMEKDQSYFLFGIPKERLGNILFPLGELTKDEVRRIATDREIPTSRRESQDVCFLVGGDYREFLEKRLDELPRAGQIVDLRGRVRGLHSGYYRYTIGQRHGIGIRSRRPFYVVDIVPEANRVVVGRLRDLYKKKVVAHGLNMLEDVGTRFRALVQVRARMQPTEAEITVEGDRAIIEFQSPVRAPARGQAAVFYDGNLVLGGGWIESTE